MSSSFVRCFVILFLVAKCFAIKDNREKMYSRKRNGIAESSGGYSLDAEEFFTTSRPNSIVVLSKMKNKASQIRKGRATYVKVILSNPKLTISRQLAEKLAQAELESPKMKETFKKLVAVNSEGKFSETLGSDYDSQHLAQANGPRKRKRKRHKNYRRFNGKRKKSNRKKLTKSRIRFVRQIAPNSSSNFRGIIRNNRHYENWKDNYPNESLDEFNDGQIFDIDSYGNLNTVENNPESETYSVNNFQNADNYQNPNKYNNPNPDEFEKNAVLWNKNYRPELINPIEVQINEAKKGEISSDKMISSSLKLTSNVSSIYNKTVKASSTISSNNDSKEETKRASEIQDSERTTKKLVSETSDNETELVAAQILNKIIDELEEIKIDRTRSDRREGLPCRLSGSWVTTQAGVGINLHVTKSIVNVSIAKLNFPDGIIHQSLLNYTWNITGYAPFKRGGPFSLTATENRSKTLAVFVGACRVCQNVDTIQGVWSISREPKDCRDFQVSTSIYNDIFRRTSNASFAKT